MWNRFWFPQAQKCIIKLRYWIITLRNIKLLFLSKIINVSYNMQLHNDYSTFVYLIQLIWTKHITITSSAFNMNQFVINATNIIYWRFSFVNNCSIYTDIYFIIDSLIVIYSVLISVNDLIWKNGMEYTTIHSLLPIDAS